MAIMSLVLPTYVGKTFIFRRRDILRRDQYLMKTFDTKCLDISFPLWVNEDMSDMSRHFFRHFQLRSEPTSSVAFMQPEKKRK